MRFDFERNCSERLPTFQFVTDFYPGMADWTREEEEEVDEEEYADLIAEETSKLQRQHDYYECKRVSQFISSDSLTPILVFSSSGIY